MWSCAVSGCDGWATAITAIPPVSVGGIATDGVHVFLTGNTDGTVMMCPVAGCNGLSPSTLAIVTSFHESELAGLHEDLCTLQLLQRLLALRALRSTCIGDGASQFEAVMPDRMERLVTAVQELSLARDLETVMRIVRHIARELRDADGAIFVLRDQSRGLSPARCSSVPMPTWLGDCSTYVVRSSAAFSVRGACWA